MSQNQQTLHEALGELYSNILEVQEKLHILFHNSYELGIDQDIINPSADTINPFFKNLDRDICKLVDVAKVLAHEHQMNADNANKILFMLETFTILMGTHIGLHGTLLNHLDREILDKLVTVYKDIGLEDALEKLGENVEKFAVNFKGSYRGQRVSQ